MYEVYIEMYSVMHVLTYYKPAVFELNKLSYLEVTFPYSYLIKSLLVPIGSSHYITM